MCPAPSLWRDPATGEGGVRDAFVLETLVSIDGMVFVRVAFELADCRPTAGEKVLTDTQRACAGDAMTLKEGHDLRSARPRLRNDLHGADNPPA